MGEMLGIELVTTAISAGSLRKVPSLVVGLHHHPRALAHRHWGHRRDDAAIDDGGVEPAGLQKRGDHRGGRRLPSACRQWRSPGGKRISSGQHLGPPHHGQQALARRDEFRIGLLDRGGDHNHLGLAQIPGAWPMKHSMPLSRSRWTLALSA